MTKISSLLSSRIPCLTMYLRFFFNSICTCTFKSFHQIHEFCKDQKFIFSIRHYATILSKTLVLKNFYTHIERSFLPLKPLKYVNNFFIFVQNQTIHKFCFQRVYIMFLVSVIKKSRYPQSCRINLNGYTSLWFMPRRRVPYRNISE